MSKQSSPRGRKPKSKLAALVSTLVGVVVVVVVVLQQLGVIDLEIGGTPGEPQGAPGDISASDVDQARERIEEIRVEEENDPGGYDRSLFPHWSEQDGCSTREIVLKRDGEGVETDEDCRSTSGSWYSAYDGETFDDAQDLDIDHMVALKEGWRSGAHELSTEDRGRFANDLDTTQLWAVSASTNRSKGDADPSDWLPPLESSHCDYVVSWIEVKHEWDLTMDPDEETAVREVLEGC